MWRARCVWEVGQFGAADKKIKEGGQLSRQWSLLFKRSIIDIYSNTDCAVMLSSLD